MEPVFSKDSVPYCKKQWRSLWESLFLGFNIFTANIFRIILNGKALFRIILNIMVAFWRAKGSLDNLLKIISTTLSGAFQSKRQCNKTQIASRIRNGCEDNVLIKQAAEQQVGKARVHERKW